jgi:hypothetical protein
MPVELRLAQSLPVMAASACWPWPRDPLATGHDPVTDVPEPGHYERHQQHHRGERVECRTGVTAPDQPAGSGAIASWSRALNEHRIRLPPDLTGDFRPAATLRPCLHDPAAPATQIIQVCARCLDAKLASLATQAARRAFTITGRVTQSGGLDQRCQCSSPSRHGMPGPEVTTGPGACQRCRPVPPGTSPPDRTHCMRHNRMAADRGASVWPGCWQPIRILSEWCH